MILPIYAYGFPLLKRQCDPIDKDYPELGQLIENMWETMYDAKGVGLAAPQIGLPIKLFLVDTQQVMDEDSEEQGIKKVFINAEMISEKGELWSYEEGCLSIPHIRGEVDRLSVIKIKYLDENFEEHIETYDSINARVIQHEYDHTMGKLFTEYLKPIKKRLVKRKLEMIRKGNVTADYRMKFYKAK